MCITLTGEETVTGDVTPFDSFDFFLDAPKQPKLSPTLFPRPPIMATARDAVEGDSELL